MTNPRTIQTRIALFIPSLAGGGAEKIILAIAGKFRDAGFAVDLLVASSRGSLASEVPSGVTLVSFDTSKPLRAVPQLVRYLRHRRPECVLSKVLSANIALLAARLFSCTNVRCVICEVSPSEHDLMTSPWASRWLTRLAVRVLYGRADAVISVSKAVSVSISKNASVRADRIHQILNPLLPEAAVPLELEPNASSIPTIVACGRLDVQKDYPTLLRAFAILHAKTPARLLILGEGPLRGELEAEASRLGISPHVSFMGFQLHPRQFMRKARVFVHSARWEGFGIVLLEALASGCTIVATDCPGGVRDALNDGEFGLLVPVEHPAALAEGLEAALSGRFTPPDPTVHLRRFDLEVVADQYMRVLFPRAFQPSSNQVDNP